jgi:hypothetical protein
LWRELAMKKPNNNLLWVLGNVTTVVTTKHSLVARHWAKCSLTQSLPLSVRWPYLTERQRTYSRYMTGTK